MQKLTDTDTQIIDALRKNARQSNKEMAEKIGVSEETVRRHVHAMVKSEALQFDVSVSAEALGLPIQALINVEVPPDAEGNLLENFGSIHPERIHVKRIYETVEGHQVYEIAAETLHAASEAVMHLRLNLVVIDATITFLYPNADHRI